jgi:DNA-binding ferritin-like protein
MIAPSAVEGEGKGEQGVAQMVECMLMVAGLLHLLQVQAHLIHLNYECSNFIGVHQWLKEQYQLHLSQFDELAELVRTLDYFMPLTMQELCSACDCFIDLTGYEPQQMLVTYKMNLESMGMKAKDIVKCARDCCAPDVENYAAELVGEAFKGAWFIKSILRNPH